MEQSEILRNLREKHNLTQEQMADRLHCQRRNKKHLKRRPENDPNAGNTYAG